MPGVTWSMYEADVRPLKERAHHESVHASLERRRVRFSSPTLSVTTSLVQAADAFKHSTVMHEHSDGVAEIDDLCHRFRLWRSKHAEIQCLGFLRDPSSEARHGVYWPENRVLNRTSAAGKSLAVMLDSQDEQILSLLEKRRLALAAALAMLRLHGTPWLGKQWGKHELVIFANAGKLVTTGAFVSTVFDAQSGGYSRYFVPCRAIRNEAIFALGILLIELALDKPFEALKRAEDLEDGDALADFYTAVRVIEDVNRTAGFRYADVVRRCIRCDFDDSGTDLNDPAFQNKVFAGVVAELEEQVSFLEPPGSE
ncbi:hypothetical protein AC579_6749 [Pseudocercospora musae]|uniref:DUF7580 domain-containing protein n=1 Tax=Pseudocercospora musae TaxID=113226 RepID=A0A139I538_9PEZI|nr:hypothetical protein AC579_6749 [Pseudocercospora musae]